MTPLAKLRELDRRGDIGARLTVRGAVRLTGGPAANVVGSLILDHEGERQSHWTRDQWGALLSQLDSDSRRVADYINDQTGD